MLEAPDIDPGTSRMLSERSTIWATPPSVYKGVLEFVVISMELKVTKGVVNEWTWLPSDTTKSCILKCVHKLIFKILKNFRLFYQTF